MPVRLTRTLPLFVVLMLSVAPHAIGQPAPLPPVPIDLGTLGGTISRAYVVSDSGQVFGDSETPAGDYHEFVWTPAGGMVDLGPSAERCEADALNRSLGFQLVVGTRIFPGADGGNPTERACVWTPATGMVDLGTLGGANSRAFAANDRQVVGVSELAGNITSHPFLWTASEGMVDLDPLSVFGNFRRGARMGINNSGQIFGAADTETLDGSFRPIERSFVWTPTSGIAILPTLGGQRNGARDMNEQGQIVGKSETGEQGPLGARVYHAYVWTPTGGMVDLGTLGGYTSEARAVNEMGDVAGTANTVGSLDWYGNQVCPFFPLGYNCEQVSIRHAFVWTTSDGMIDLGTLGGVQSEADAINDQGDVIGWSHTGRVNDGDHAFVWTAAEGMADLAQLPGFAISRAIHINNRRQIVGYSLRFAPSFPVIFTRATMWELASAADVTRPTLTLPATIVVDGTSPAGATVTYAVSATDNQDANPVVTCSPPSGSVFPLGPTMVSCTATDAAGNSTTDAFQVVVLGATQQLQQTIELITDYQLTRLGTSLPDKLQLASGFVEVDNVVAACDVLTGFLNQVRAQAGKALTYEQAAELITRANRIRNVIGC